MIELIENDEVLTHVTADDIVALTANAVAATFDAAGLTKAQQAANRRVVAISAGICADAAASDCQYLAAAFSDGAFAGYVIATLRGEDDRELDWLMVHPAFHGTGIAAMLMDKGIDWLGRDRPSWLNVISHNARAIRFYRRFGFEIDAEAKTGHVVPHVIMRRSGDGFATSASV